MTVATQIHTLRSSLNYEPRELEFGTSGRRGKVVDLTQLEVYINALAELEYLQSLSPAEGGILRGEEFFFARDLRLSSDRFVPDEKGRGEIAQAIVAAIRDAGMRADQPWDDTDSRADLLCAGAWQRQHDDYRQPHSIRPQWIQNQQQQRRVAQGAGSADQRAGPKGAPTSIQPGSGSSLCLITAECSVPAIRSFQRRSVKPAPRGSRDSPASSRMHLCVASAYLVDQQSAVGRDLLVEVLERMNAEVIAVGRSAYVRPHRHGEHRAPRNWPRFRRWSSEATAEHGPIDAIVSTDGDSDRPLILGVDPATAKAHFFGGDLVGMVVAEYLKADAVVVPISCNDAVDRGKSEIRGSSQDAHWLALCDCRHGGSTALREEACLRLGTQWWLLDWFGHCARWCGSAGSTHERCHPADPLCPLRGG